MKTTVEKLPKSQVKLTIELVAEELQKYRDEAIADLSKELDIPGFRLGHVPKDIAKSRLGADLILNKTLEKAIPITYAEAVVKEKVQVVAKPSITIISEEPLKFEAVVAVLPEVKFKKNPSEIKIPAPEVIITEQEENDALKNLRNMFAKAKEVDEPAKVGHKVEVSFEGFDDKGEPVPGTKSSKHPLIIGEGVLCPDFEQHLVGLKSADAKEFAVMFPADYHRQEFRGKKIRFKANMDRVMQVTLPELTEAFVEKITGKKQSMVEFKATFKKSLLHGKKADEKQRRENQFLEELIKIAEIDVPEALIDEEIDFLISNTKISLKQKGIPFPEYEKFLAEKKIDLRAKFRVEAEKYVTLRLVLHHLFEKYEIAVTDDHVDERIAQIVAGYPGDEQPKVRQHYADHEQPRNQLRNRMKMDKLFEIYLGSEK